MRAHGVVMPVRTFHDGSGLGERMEDLTVERSVLDSKRTKALT